MSQQCHNTLKIARKIRLENTKDNHHNKGMKKLIKEFFNQPTLTVAKELLGARIHFNGKTGVITETEAYGGAAEPDEGSHAHKGKTPRNAIMFDHPGLVYVYLIYGMYHCMNFIAEDHGIPAAVLIRGVIGDDGVHYNGPGKLTRYFGITKDQNGVDLFTDNKFFVEQTEIEYDYETTPRIGLKQGVDKHWRFLAKV